jgi:hypothetical protein
MGPFRRAEGRNKHGHGEPGLDGIKGMQNPLVLSDVVALHATPPLCPAVPLPCPPLMRHSVQVSRAFVSPCLIAHLQDAPSTDALVVPERRARTIAARRLRGRGCWPSWRPSCIRPLQLRRG